uniref:Elongation factor Ts, mitochondrial n=1 Tax=Hyaloperonospora arabidopsidis (strain Emoy2) TaxID=559515 RepID=M4BQE9_HYAAE
MVLPSLSRWVRPTSLRSSRCLSTYKPDIAAVKKLRTESQAPLQDVRNALVATEGDFPAAFEWLRKKGIASAGKKAGRCTAEGLVGVHVTENGLSAAMVEVNSETDFVAMNDKFQALVRRVADALTTSEPVIKSAGRSVVTDFLSADQLAVVDVDGSTVAEKVPELVGVVGENVVATRAVQFKLTEGLICSYVHNIAAPGLGRAGALVALQFPSKTASADQVAGVQELGRRLAMHVVAARPRFLNREMVPQTVVDKERAFLTEQVKDSDKPPHIVAKMTDGRLAKFFGEVTLLEQDHLVEEGNPKVGVFVAQRATKLGLDVSVAAYERFEVGESKEEEGDDV